MFWFRSNFKQFIAYFCSLLHVICFGSDCVPPPAADLLPVVLVHEYILCACGEFVPWLRHADCKMLEDQSTKITLRLFQHRAHAVCFNKRIYLYLNILLCRNFHIRNNWAWNYEKRYVCTILLCPAVYFSFLVPFLSCKKRFQRSWSTSKGVYLK